MTDITGRVALVTGANRGLGAAFVAELLERGASKVYAAARRPGSVQSDDPRVVPLELDVTDPESIGRAASIATDVSILVNNAGIAVNQSLVSGDLEEIRRELDTNFWGPVLVTRAFSPILEANGGGAIVNMHSTLSWLGVGSYSASKAALWSASNSVRVDLAPAGIQVVGVHVGYVDTDMAADVTADKVPPQQVVEEALDAVKNDEAEAVVGDTARYVKSHLHEDVRVLYPQLAR
ncbi:SDR family oxidoreductase [Leifsonia shinshuensis]|uniref:SDR family oxidoreductase n=1 Tax=Leifsonia shinshuensis TaxID=150026 RepID=UPI00285F267B|nr:SDR family oxidoreductase [Leifsonia shinshuensis]MDR6971360.1 NAD(P)-dependent dehydrogenase (short-subunit alcohol dehydrogenase family) [Leifsonia shinshuensis]